MPAKRLTMRPWIIDADDIEPSGDFRDSIKLTPRIHEFLGRSSSRFIVTTTVPLPDGAGGGGAASTPPASTA